MSILRKYLIENFRETYNNVSYTYGYETKSRRIANRLEKDHNVDARCISGNFSAKPDVIYLYKKVRCHNRQIHKFKTLKGGIRKLNQSPYMIHGFRLFDKVRINNQTGFIYGRRHSGSYLVKDIDGNIISSGISYKKLSLIEKRKGWIVDFKQS